jgi:hypothetical protein
VLSPHGAALRVPMSGREKQFFVQDARSVLASIILANCTPHTGCNYARVGLADGEGDTSIVESRRQSEVLSPPLFLLPKIQPRKPTFSTSGSWSPGSTSSSTFRSPMRIRFLYSAGVSMSVPPRHMPRRATLTRAQ